MVRARGEGSLEATTVVGADTNSTDHVSIVSTQWEWLTIPIARFEGYRSLDLVLRLAEGYVEADQVILTAGEWPAAVEVGTTIRVPAPCFFHAGYTDLADETVVLRRAYEPDRAVVYGRIVPLPPGQYGIEFRFSSQARKDTEVGRIEIKSSTEEMAAFPVRVGHEAKASFVNRANLPVRVSFIFARNADVRMREMILTRIR